MENYVFFISNCKLHNFELITRNACIKRDDRNMQRKYQSNIPIFGCAMTEKGETDAVPF